MHLALAHLAETGERWLVVSDEPTNLTTLDEYGLRFDIEIIFTQMTKGRMLACGGRLGSITDFHLIVIDDDSVDQQLYQLPALSEVELFERWLQTPTEVFNAGGKLGRVQLLLGLRLQLT